MKLIAAERIRQIEQEGWAPQYDDRHAGGEMALAAACYALAEKQRGDHPPSPWPWSREWWKPSPSNRIRELAKAGALIVAEIERLARMQRRQSVRSEPVNVLVVGGAHDGRIICLNSDGMNAHRLRMPYTVTPPLAWPHEVNRTMISYEEYQLDWVDAGAKRLWFLRLVGMTNEQAVEMIFNNYRPASCTAAAELSITSMAEQIAKIETHLPECARRKNGVLVMLQNARKLLSGMVGWR